MFHIDNKDIIKLEKKLKYLSYRSLPFATKQTLNDAAFQTQKIAKADITKKMIQRNKFTLQSIRVNKASGLDIRRQQSIIGSTADYMEIQEFGGQEKKSSKVGKPIATSYSSGEGQNTQPRMRLPVRTNKLQNIQLKRQRFKYKGRKQQNAILVREASKSNNKFVYLDLGQTKGIFKVVGKKKSIKVRMVHDLSRSSVTISKNPWLKPATDETLRMLPAFYADALRFQLRRLKS